MPRKAREKSGSGIYHVMMRGVNRQLIFEDREDREYFLELLLKYRKRSGFELYGYCLLGNHVHLLLKECAGPSIVEYKGEEVEIGEGEELEAVFKRINVSYVAYFNRKYKRTGHLFQDRFKSECVENDDYLLHVLRYIHMNPVKAGICEKPEEYEFSSFNEYMEGPKICKTGFVLGMLSREKLRDFTYEKNEDKFMDVDETADEFLTDEDVKQIIKSLTGCANTAEFQKLDINERNNAFVELVEAGIPVAQISRMTGYSRMLVYRAAQAPQLQAASCKLQGDEVRLRG